MGPFNRIKARGRAGVLPPPTAAPIKTTIAAKPVFGSRLVTPGPSLQLFEEALAHVTHPRTQWNYQIVRLPQLAQGINNARTVVARALDPDTNPYREVWVENRGWKGQRLTVVMRNHERFTLNTLWGTTTNPLDWFRRDSRQHLSKLATHLNTLKTLAK